MILSAPGEARGALEAALRTKGESQNGAWNGHVIVTMTSNEPGSVTAGAGEFAGLSGTYTETWTVTGVDEAGEIDATVELNTITRRPE